MMDDEFRVWGKTDGKGLVIRSDEPVDFHPINKTANVVRVDSLDDAMKWVNVATQTVGFYPFDRMADYRDRLASGGAQRIVHLGEAGPTHDRQSARRDVSAAPLRALDGARGRGRAGRRSSEFSSPPVGCLAGPGVEGPVGRVEAQAPGPCFGEDGEVDRFAEHRQRRDRWHGRAGEDGPEPVDGLGRSRRLTSFRTVRPPGGLRRPGPDAPEQLFVPVGPGRTGSLDPPGRARLLVGRQLFGQ